MKRFPKKMLLPSNYKIRCGPFKDVFIKYRKNDYVQMIRVINANDNEMFKSILKDGISLNDDEHYSIIHKIIENNHFDILKTYIEKYEQSCYGSIIRINFNYFKYLANKHQDKEILNVLISLEKKFIFEKQKEKNDLKRTCRIFYLSILGIVLYPFYFK
jgi:hypothetical protein